MGSDVSKTKIIDTEYFYKDAQQAQYDNICKIVTLANNGSYNFGTGTLLHFDEKECYVQSAVNNPRNRFGYLAQRVLCGPLSNATQQVVLTAKHVVPILPLAQPFANTTLRFDAKKLQVSHGIAINKSDISVSQSYCDPVVRPDLMLLFPEPAPNTGVVPNSTSADFKISKTDLLESSFGIISDQIRDVKIIGHGFLNATQRGSELVYDTSNPYPNSPNGYTKATKTLDVIDITNDENFTLTGKQTNLLVLKTDRRRNCNHLPTGPGDSGAPVLMNGTIIGIHLGGKIKDISSSQVVNLQSYALNINKYKKTICNTIYWYRYFNFYANASASFMTPIHKRMFVNF